MLLPRPCLPAAAAATTILALSLAPAPAGAQAHGAPAPNNITSLEGTWASGSGNVTTGLSFYNPSNAAFNIPATSGIAYSFTDDGFFEQSKYLYTSNATVNRCVKASLIWQHGSYVINTNGSLSLHPWKADGKVMVIDACGAQTLQQFYYSQPELIPLWYNYIEPDTGFGAKDATVQNANPAYALQMFQDGGNGQAGQKMPVLYLQLRPPNMLPTQALNEDVLNSAALSADTSAAPAATGTTPVSRRRVFRS